MINETLIQSAATIALLVLLIVASITIASLLGFVTVWAIQKARSAGSNPEVVAFGQSPFGQMVNTLIKQGRQQFDDPNDAVFVALAPLLGQVSKQAKQQAIAALILGLQEGFDILEDITDGQPGTVGSTGVGSGAISTENAKG